jgi:SAM-dependent methyltransferase
VRLDLRPDTIAERAALALGLVPTPFLHTHPTLLLARVLLVATERDVFEALADGPRSAAEVAETCGTHLEATARLLDALVGAGYLRRPDGYALAPLARKWLLRDSPQSLRDSLLFRKLEWDWMARLDDFVDRGEPLDFHATMTEEEWGLYQRGMRALARLAVPETVRRAPVPAVARDLLDVGGAHGAFSVALCERYPALSAVVLDLPAAVAESAPLLDEAAIESGVRDRIAHRSGDALDDDLGTACFDVVFVGQFIHHFDDATGRALVEQFARALRPGGVLVIQEVMRAARPEAAGQLGALADLYFALTSAAGTRTFDELADWQRAAGLDPHRPVRFRTLPGVGQQNATKPA